MKTPEVTRIRVGCAGWSLPKTSADRFGSIGTHLERYASRYNAVEINSTFYKSHRQSTFTRWGQSVPKDFRFSMKVPKEITHQKKLQIVSADLAGFLAAADGLGNKLDVFLVQLPPTLQYNVEVVANFFEIFRAQWSRSIVCEPRHKSWFTDQADRLLKKFHVARAASDPAIVPQAAEPGGWNQLVYYRLHGSPRKYYSAYAHDYLKSLSQRLRIESKSKSVWCVFDNTASGAAIENANSLLLYSASPSISSETN